MTKVFCVQQKTSDEAVLEFLKVSGCKELCLKGASRYLVRPFLSHDKIGFRLGVLLVFVNPCLCLAKTAFVDDKNTSGRKVRNLGVILNIKLKTVKNKFVKSQSFVLWNTD